MPLPEDTMLENRYRIDRLLTVSSNGATYRAFDTEQKVPVAIKEKHLERSIVVNQFMQDALILTNLEHPALVKVTHHFSHEGQQYLVTDFVAAESLWERITHNKQPLSEQQALTYISKVCQAVTYLHEQDPPVFHRDIKPQNIKVTDDNRVILVDYGVAKSGGATNLSVYTAPEQNIGFKISPASDLYALGTTLYTLLTGELPPPRSGVEDFTPKHDDLREELAELIGETTRYKMETRPASVALWQAKIEQLIKTASTVPPAASSFSALATETPLPPPPSLTRPKFWLVDSTGLGYPLSEKELTIGRSPEAHIHLEQKDISPKHALIRTETNQNCVIQDMGSRSGTTLNNQPLGSSWYPFAPGDILVIGSTRFHLTTTKPVKIGSTTPVAQQTVRAKPPPPPSIPAPLKQIEEQLRELPFLPPIYLIALFIILLLLAGGIYFLFFSGEPPLSAAAITTNIPASSTATRPPETPVSETAPEKATPEPTAKVEAVGQDPTPTSEPDQPEPTATSTETATPMPPTNTVTASPTPTEPATAQASPTPLQDTIIVTPSPTSSATATLAPTKTATISSPPTPNQPTVIPLAGQGTLTQIGTQEVTDVDINPKNPLEVYALVKGQAIYRSGSAEEAPWIRVPVDASSVVSFIIDPSTPTRLYASTWNAVLKSTDGGNSWEANTSGLLGNQTVDIVSIDPVDPSILYAGIGEEFVASSDGGQTWSSAQHGNGLGVAKFYDIVIDPFDSNTVYVAGLAGSIYKSTDGGRTFGQLPDNIGQGAFSMTPHPTQKNVYFVGINSAEAAILKTEDGISFTSISSGLVYGGADSPYSAIAFAPSDPDIVYTGTGAEDNRLGKGIFKSSNGGETWQSISSDLPRHPNTRQPYYVKALAVHPTDPDTVYAATGGGLFKSVDGGGSWEQQ